MEKKEIPVTTRILISIIVVVAAGISIINMLTIYGVLETPDLLTYVIMIGVYTLPFIIIGATVNKIFIEQKQALENISQGTKDVGRRLELKINFKPWENIMADTTSHPAFYVKIAIASALSVSVGLLSYSLFSQHVLVGPLSTMIPAFAPLFAVCLLIHLFSKHIFGPQGWRELLEHSWISLLVITFSLSMMISLRAHITESYPRQFWERFLDFPFSLPTLMFFAIMLIIGGILIRLGDIIRFESSPLKASGTTFVLLSIAFLFPRFDLLDWDLLLSIVSQLFAVSLIFYGLAVAGLLYKDAGMRFLVTNERVIKLDTNRLERSSYYPLLDLKDVEIVQDFLASTFNYGNVVMTFNIKKGVKKAKVYCILYGVKNPELITNTIKAISNLKRTQMRPKKPVIKKKEIKKRPLKKKKIPVKKKRKKAKKDEFYYRVMIPVLALLMMSLFTSCAYGGSEDNPDRMIFEFYEIDYISATRTDINASYEIYAYTFDGVYLEADEIRELAKISPDDVERMENVLYNMTEENIEYMMNSLFKSEREGLQIIYNISVVHDSLYGEPEEDFPIIYDIHISVDTKPIYFGLPADANIDAIFMGMLESGAMLEIGLELVSDPGHRAVFVFNSMEDTVFTDEGTSLSFEVDNIHGKERISEMVSIEMHHAQPTHIEDTDIQTSLLIDIYSLERGEKGEFLDINVNFSASLSSIRVPETLRRYIPEEINIEYLDAKGIRVIYSHGLSKPFINYVSTYEEVLKEQVGSWGEEVIFEEMKIGNLERGREHQPIKIYYNASIRAPLSRPNDDVSAFIPREFSFSDNFNMNLRGIEEAPINITIMIPEGLELMRARLNRRNIPIRQNEDGRYYTTATLEQGETQRLTLVIGTTVYLMEFLPFAILIIVLLFIWIGLNVYRVKPKK